MLRCVPHPFIGGTSRVIVATVYARHDLYDAWPFVLLVHAFVAAASAVALSAVWHLRGTRRGDDRHAVRTQFRLSSLLRGMLALAIVFGLLRFGEAPPVVFAAVLVAVLGQPLTALLVAALDRGRR